MKHRHRRNVIASMLAWRPLTVVIVALATYWLLSAGPFLLRRYSELEFLGRVLAALAPLAGSILLIPLPSSVWRLHRERRLLRKLQSIEALRAMTWSELEILVRAVFARFGYAAARVGGNRADGGIDIALRKAGRLAFVQCKQWRARQVSVNVIRELLGVISLHGADGGFVVTCGSFTKDARNFAQQANITLIDGMALLDLTRPTSAAHARATIPLFQKAQREPEDACACPACGGRMVLRTARSGRLVGRSFLGCAKFPDCRGIRDL